MIGLLAMAAAVTSSDAFAAQASRCGIKSDQIVWSTDAQGRRHASITPNGDLDSLGFPALKCMLEWGQRTGNRIGFVSEPPAK